MNQRAFAWLSLTVVFLGLVYYFAREDDSPRGGANRVDVFGDVDGEQVAKISIAQSDKSVELIEQDDRWRVPARANYFASGDKIRALLVKLINLSVTQKVTEDPEKFAALGVDDKAVESGKTKVVLATRDGKEIASLILGETRKSKRPDPMAPSGGGQYVRRSGANEVYLVSEQLSFATIPEEWLEQELFTVPQSRVRSVAQLIRTDGGWKEIFRVTSGPEGSQARTFQLASVKSGETPEEATISQLASGLENIRISDVVPAAEVDEKLKGVKFDNRTVYETNDGLLYTVDSGKDGEKLFAKVDVAYSDAVAKSVETEIKSHNERVAKERAAATPAPTAAKVDAGDDEEEVDVADVPEVELLTAKLSNAEEAKKLDDRFANWAYQLPQYFSQKLRQTRESLMKSSTSAAK